MYETQCKMCGKRMTARLKCEIRTFCSKECYGAFLHQDKGMRSGTWDDMDGIDLRSLTDDCFIDLIAAIVAQASSDVLHYSSNSEHRITAEKFFLSSYFEMLTGFDGRPFLAMLHAERRERMRKKSKGGNTVGKA